MNIPDRIEDWPDELKEKVTRLAAEEVLGWGSWMRYWERPGQHRIRFKDFNPLADHNDAQMVAEKVLTKQPEGRLRLDNAAYFRTLHSLVGVNEEEWLGDRTTVMAAFFLALPHQKTVAALKAKGVL